ncbi:MAG: phosphatase PAP2 family protein [Caldilineaceae bacterium]
MTQNRKEHRAEQTDTTAKREPSNEQTTSDAKISAADLATAPLRNTLQKALNAVDSQEKADELFEKLAQRPEQHQPIDAIADDEPTHSAAAAAAKVAAVDHATPGETPPQAVLAESARAVVTTEGADREAVSDAIQTVFTPRQEEASTSGQEQQRSYLRQALRKRLGPLDALDADLFLWINQLPHPRPLNRLFYFLTVIYRAGAAWYALMLFVAAWRPQLGRRLVRDTALPLGLAIWLVEYPIKTYFRRRRPFISIVQAIVIGRKPGSWSFPSGHAATAFAGAWLLSHCLPRWRFPLYLVATLTAFSRIYLGVHYPGDVVAGSTLGVLFAAVLRRLPWPWRSATEE